MGFYGPKMLIIRICEVMLKLKEGEKEQEGNYCCGDANFGSKFPDWRNWIPGFAEGRTAKKKEEFKRPAIKRQQKRNKKGPNIDGFLPHTSPP